MNGKKILMVAYHFPPMKGSSGLQRTLSFANHLAADDWQVTVLSILPSAYENVSEDQLGDIDSRITVIRAPGFDAERQLSIKGKYFRFTAMPDRWGTWALLGPLWARWKARNSRPDLVWSTYPIATAHKVGARLARWFGVPHVVDFRDQMVEGDYYPSDPDQYTAYLKIEQDVVRRAALCVFTAPGTLAMYRERYPQLDERNSTLIENGFDGRYAAALPPAKPLSTEPVRLLHSGIVYPQERDPTALFDALAELWQEGEKGIQLTLRAPGNEALFKQMVAERELEACVEIAPTIAYAAALEEMLDGRVLLVLQAASCNHQIPAKLYEYLSSGQPIMALTPPESDTATVVRSSGCPYIADLSDRAAIKQALLRLISDARSNALVFGSRADADQYDRKHRAVELNRRLRQLLEARVTQD